jgi:hypothetical protein
MLPGMIIPTNTNETGNRGQYWCNYSNATTLNQGMIASNINGNNENEHAGNCRSWDFIFNSSEGGDFATF